MQAIIRPRLVRIILILEPPVCPANRKVKDQVKSLIERRCVLNSSIAPWIIYGRLFDEDTLSLWMVQMFIRQKDTHAVC